MKSPLACFKWPCPFHNWHQTTHGVNFTGIPMLFLPPARQGYIEFDATHSGCSHAIPENAGIHRHKAVNNLMRITSWEWSFQTLLPFTGNHISALYAIHEIVSTENARLINSFLQAWHASTSDMKNRSYIIKSNNNFVGWLSHRRSQDKALLPLAFYQHTIHGSCQHHYFESSTHTRHQELEFLHVSREIWACRLLHHGSHSYWSTALIHLLLHCVRLHLSRLALVRENGSSAWLVVKSILQSSYIFEPLFHFCRMGAYCQFLPCYFFRQFLDFLLNE